MISQNNNSAQGKGFGFLFEMGCGKTLTAIAVAGTGYKLGHLKRVLIVAPTNVCAVWPKEFQEYADFPYTVRTLLGTKAQRLKELDDLEKWPFPALQVAVINYESTWREGIFERLAMQFIKLSNTEMYAIWHHMGFTEQGADFGTVGRAMELHPAVLALHTADMMASRFMEGVSGNKEIFADMPAGQEAAGSAAALASDAPQFEEAPPLVPGA